MGRRSLHGILSLFAALVGVLADDGLRPAECRAADWPQLLGPNRDGWSADGERLGDWQSEPPRERWRQPVGDGYAGPVIVDGTVILIHRMADEDLVERRKLEDGALVWQSRVEELYGKGGVDADRGPRCTPVVSGQIVLCTTAAGDLHALRLEDGKALWMRPLRQETDAGDGYFGASTTPIVIDQTVIAIVGGTEGRAIIGLDLASGATRWQAAEGQAEYASPIAVEIAGEPVAICPLQTETVAVRATDGRIRWRTPYGRRGTNVIAATPIRLPRDTVLLTASYGIDAKCLQIGDGREQWSSGDAISSQFVTPIMAAGHLYGCHGREDQGAVELRCCDPLTGKLLWSKPQYGVAHWIGVGAELLACGLNGQLERVAIDPTGFRSLGRYQIANPGGRSPQFRAIPALADGYLAMRSSGANAELLVLRVR